MPRSASDTDRRLQAIAEALGLPVAVFFDEPVTDAGSGDPSLNELRRALISAAEAFNQGIQRKAQSVSLAETA